MFSNKILYKVAILSTLVLTFGILDNGGNLVQAQTPTGSVTPPGGAGTITTATTTIPSNNVTALNVYDNSTMVLEFGNGTTLASPYSNVWRISFLPAGNQTIGNTTTGVAAAPPGGGGGGVAAAPPGGGGGGVAADNQQQLPEDQQQLQEYQQQLEEDQQQPQADEQQIQADEQQIQADEQQIQDDQQQIQADEQQLEDEEQ